MTRDEAEEFLVGLEKRLLEPRSGNYWPITSISSYGIELSWRKGRKRDGCTLRRGKQYGYIEYAIAHGHYEIASRDDVLLELQKPDGLRKAMQELEAMIICARCGAAEVDWESQRLWEQLCYYKPTGRVRILRLMNILYSEPIYDDVRFHLCNKCVGAIAEECGLV